MPRSDAEKASQQLTAICALLIVVLVARMFLSVPPAYDIAVVEANPVSQDGLYVFTDKTQYALGETVTVAVVFVHGPLDILMLHEHWIRAEVYDQPGGKLVQSWSWLNIGNPVGGSRSAVNVWKPNQLGVYTIAGEHVLAPVLVPIQVVQTTITVNVMLRERILSHHVGCIAEARLCE